MVATFRLIGQNLRTVYIARGVPPNGQFRYGPIRIYDTENNGRPRIGRAEVFPVRPISARFANPFPVLYVDTVVRNRRLTSMDGTNEIVANGFAFLHGTTRSWRPLHDEHYCPRAGHVAIRTRSVPKRIGRTNME